MRPHEKIARQLPLRRERAGCTMEDFARLCINAEIVSPRSNSAAAMACRAVRTAADRTSPAQIRVTWRATGALRLLGGPGDLRRHRRRRGGHLPRPLLPGSGRRLAHWRCQSTRTPERGALGRGARHGVSGGVMAVNAGPEGRLPDGGHWRRHAGGTHADAALASRSAVTPGARTAMTAAALAAMLGLAAACWVIAAWQMNGMDMGAATRLGSFGVFTGGSQARAPDVRIDQRHGQAAVTARKAAVTARKGETRQ